MKNLTKVGMIIVIYDTIPVGITIIG